MMRLLIPYKTLIYLLAAVAIVGCSTDESAMMCVDQVSGADGVRISNRCNQTITVVADNGEKLIIAAGLTHLLTGTGKQMGVCFSPKEPKLAGNGFSCE